MTALGVVADGLRRGEIPADEVASEARYAARRVGYVKPRDPALQRAQYLIDGTLNEYGAAVSLSDEERDRAGLHMHRSYGLANVARDVLVEAQPALAKRGCDRRAAPVAPAPAGARAALRLQRGSAPAGF